MANRQRAEARRKAAAKAARQEGSGGKRVWMWSAIGVIVVVAIVAIIVAGGSDKKSNSAADGSLPTTTISKIPDSQPVTITGTDLPQEPKDKNAPDTAIGMTAPIVSGLNFQGQTIKLDPSEGPFLAVFLAHWCPHCNAEVPRLLDWKHSGAVPKELNVIGVATAVSPSSVNYPPAQWFSNKGWEWPVLVDQSQGDGAAGKVAAAYGASGWPYLVLVGKDGKVKMRTSGEVAIADLQKLVDKALAS